MDVATLEFKGYAHGAPRADQRGGGHGGGEERGDWVDRRWIDDDGFYWSMAGLVR